jgi:hypothetical protein
MKRPNEYAAFTDLATKILSVPHNEVKAKLEGEKRTKKRKKSKKSSASDREGA